MAYRSLSFPIWAYLSRPIAPYQGLSYQGLSFPIWAYPIKAYRSLSRPIAPIKAYRFLSRPIAPIKAYRSLSSPIAPIKAYPPIVAYSRLSPLSRPSFTLPLQGLCRSRLRLIRRG